MPRKIKAVYDPAKYDDGEAMQLADTVVASQTGAPLYPVPSPALAAIVTAKTELNDAIVIRDTVGGGTENIKAVKTKRAQLDHLLRGSRDYVNSLIPVNSIIENGVDVTAERIVDGSGFPRNHQPVPQGNLPAVSNLRQIIRNNIPPGAIKANWDKLANNAKYEVVVTNTVGTPAYNRTLILSNTRLELNDLTSGGQYSVVVTGINAEGEGVPSNPLLVRAL